MTNTVHVTCGFLNFKNSIPKTNDCGIFAIGKISLNNQAHLMLSLIFKPVITIFCLLIGCSLIVTKLNKISKILRDNCVVYPQEIRLASLLESIKAKNSSLNLFCLTLQVMHSNYSNFPS